MSSQTYVLTGIPNWMVTTWEGLKAIYHYLGATWSICLFVVIAAIVVSAIVEIRKRRYTKKQLEDLSKKAVSWWLVISSAVISGAGYIVLFLQPGLSVAQVGGKVGQLTTAIAGVSYFLYNLRLNKTWQKVSEKLSKWVGKTPTEVTVPPQPQTAASDPNGLS